VEHVWLIAALWIGLALVASVLSVWLTVSVALTEIVVGAVAGNLIHLQLNDWINWLAGFGAILLTFLAGVEIDRAVIKRNFWSTMCIGGTGFFAPYLGVMFFCSFRLRLAVAAGADRRHFAVHHFGRGGLCCDDRDRIQQDRDRQGDTRCLFCERSRHRAGAGVGFRQLQLVAHLNLSASLCERSLEGSN